MYLGILMQQTDINVKGRLQIAMLSSSYKVTGANGNPDELVLPASRGLSPGVGAPVFLPFSEAQFISECR